MTRFVSLNGHIVELAADQVAAYCRREGITKRACKKRSKVFAKQIKLSSPLNTLNTLDDDLESAWDDPTDDGP